MISPHCLIHLKGTGYWRIFTLFYRRIKKDNSKLSKSVAILDKKKEETKSINASLKSSKEEYVSVRKDLSTLQSETQQCREKFKSAQIRKDIAEDDYNKSINKLDILRRESEKEINSLESILSDKKNYFQSETARLDKLLADRIEEISNNTDLANRKAKEYEIILSKVMLAEKKIEDAENKVKNILDSKESAIEQVKSDSIHGN